VKKLSRVGFGGNIQKGGEQMGQLAQQNAKQNVCLVFGFFSYFYNAWVAGCCGCGCCPSFCGEGKYHFDFRETPTLRVAQWTDLDRPFA